MNDLVSRSCEACRAGAPTVTPEQLGELLPRLPEWRIVREQESDRLLREFTFPDFAAALDFTNRVGAIAEAEGHHPALLTEWGRVTVRWWTHKIKGLHVNDFIMAAKTDELLRTST
ncbi:MAG: 4a-hydroxytetrahydrobiopterin dehydratase [Gammaproteobacteria bacterium]|nr:4a-hydroxytetrahydrobiopterin dehydratase [Gammaproteobacteria bacterium]